MAKYYAAASLTGTGTVGAADNPAAPYDIQKLLAASGTPSYTQNDAVCVKTDGTYQLTAPLRLPDWSYLPLVAPVDPATNQLSTSRATINAASLGGGQAAFSCPGSYYLCVVGLHVKNSPGVGFLLNNAFTVALVGCDAEACATHGFLSVSDYNTRAAFLAYCRAWANTNDGIYIPTGAQISTLSAVAYRCAGWSNGGLQINLAGQGSLNLGCVVDMPMSGTSPALGSYGSYLAATFDCTVDGTGTVNRSGIVTTSSQQQALLFQSVVANLAGAGAPFTMNSTGAHGGNVAWAAAASNWSTKAIGQPDALVNPVFVDPVNDLRPTVDLAAYARFPKLAQEAAWLVPGALPSASAPPPPPATGGISRARILGGL